jgi:hypothetical protein
VRSRKEEVEVRREVGSRKSEAEKWEVGSGKWKVEMRSGRGKWQAISEKQEVGTKKRKGDAKRRGAVDDPQAHDEAGMLATSHFTLHNFTLHT